jgi:RNA polymerase sigma factor for flagellar operon FliA
MAGDSNDLVTKHAPLVKRIAYHLMSRLPPSVQADDLIQAGMIGLLEASRNYDASQGASFETYAGIRIRGAMLDEIRKNDWAPRSVHRKARKVAEAVRQIEHQKGRDARDNEVATALGMSLDEYHQMLQDASGYLVLSFDDMGNDDESLASQISDNAPGPFEGLQKEDFKKNLAESIAGLPERERLVMTLYYDEELNLREIGAVLGVSESRVSQIHSQALLRLQARLGQWMHQE